MEQSRKPLHIKIYGTFYLWFEFHGLADQGCLALWTLSFPKDSKKCPFFKMGLRTKSIKTRKKLSIFSKELTFVVVKTTFVFEKEEKEEEVLQKKNEKHNKIRSSGFFSCHTVFYI